MMVDFRKTRWGHNIFLRHVAGDRFSGLVITSPAIEEGDVMVWATQYGHAEARVDKVEPKGDPHDMYKVEATVINRVADADIVSQEEIDEFFGSRD